MTLAVMLPSLLILSELAFGTGSSCELAALEDEIWELRARGQYASAAAEASRYLEGLQPGCGSARERVKRVEGLLLTLSFIDELPKMEKRTVTRADSLARDGMEFHEKGLFAQAHGAFEEEVLIRRRLQAGTSDLANSCRRLGWAELYTGSAHEAESSFRDAVDIAEQILGEHATVAAALDGVARALWDQGKNEAAVHAFREAVSMWRRLSPDAREATLGHSGLDPRYYDASMSLDTLGIVLHQLGRDEEAAAAYGEALAIRRRLLGDHPDLVVTMTGLARVLATLGRRVESLALQREALEVSGRLFSSDDPRYARSLWELASIFLAYGEYTGAEAMFRGALSIQRQTLGTHPHVSETLNDLASVVWSRGNLIEAEQLFRESIAMDRELFGPRHEYVAIGLGNLAGVLRGAGRVSEAAELARQALDIYRDSGDEVRTAYALTNLALAEASYGDLEEAERLERQALEIRRSVLGSDVPEVGLSLLGLGRLHRIQGDYEQAEKHLTEALDILSAYRVLDDSRLRSARHQLAKVLLAQHREGEAKPLLRESVHSYERARPQQAGSGLSKALYERTSPHLDLAICHLELGEPDSAWCSLERGLARTLKELLAESKATAGLDSLRRELRSLEDEMVVTASVIDAGLDSTAANSRSDVRSRLLGTQARVGAFEAFLGAAVDSSVLGPPSLERVQSLLPESRALIGWIDSRRRDSETDPWGFVIRHRGPVNWFRLRRAEGEECLEEPGPPYLGHALRECDSPRLAIDISARSLWGRYIEPLQGSLDGVDELVVMPSGWLLGTPAEVLRDPEGNLLGEKYLVTYSPSAGIYCWLEGRREHDRTDLTSKALLIGDPLLHEEQLSGRDRRAGTDALPLDRAEGHVEDGTRRGVLAGSRQALANLPDLPGTRTEIGRLEKLWAEPTVLLGADATEQGLATLAESGELAEYGTVHLATHALIDDEIPARSALVLSQVGLPDALRCVMEGSPVHDGLLSAAEVLADWRLHAELVTLSACETGLGRDVPGDGYVGLADAFLCSGAASLLVSLWAVDDAATSLLMTRFYRNWLGVRGDPVAATVRRMSKAGALQEAKAWLRDYTDEAGVKPYEHPHYWAAFVLIGRGD